MDARNGIQSEGFIVVRYPVCAITCILGSIVGRAKSQEAAYGMYGTFDCSRVYNLSCLTLATFAYLLVSLYLVRLGIVADDESPKMESPPSPSSYPPSCVNVRVIGGDWRIGSAQWRSAHCLKPSICEATKCALQDSYRGRWFTWAVDGSCCGPLEGPV